MALNIKASGTEGMALQVTSQAKKAGLVEETTDGAGEKSYTYKAEVRVFGFPGLLLVVDCEKMDDKHVVELVTTVANDIDATETAGDAAVTRAGGGCRSSSRQPRTLASTSGIQPRVGQFQTDF